MLFAPANNILQAESTDLSTGITLIAACAENVHYLRTEKKFCDKWNEVVTQIEAHSRQTRRDHKLLLDYVVEETTGNNELNKDEMRRLLYGILDQVINEIDVRFSHQNTKLYAVVSALQLQNSNFLDVKMMQPLLDLLDRTSVKAELDVVKTYVAKCNGDEKTKLTTTKLLSEHCEALKVMPAVHLTLKLL